MNGCYLLPRVFLYIYVCLHACMHACIRRIHAHIHEHACLPIWPIHAFTNILTSRSSSWPMARPVCLNECVCVYMCTHACEFMTDAAAFGFQECTAVCLCTYVLLYMHIYTYACLRVAGETAGRRPRLPGECASCFHPQRSCRPCARG